MYRHEPPPRRVSRKPTPSAPWGGVLSLIAALGTGPGACTTQEAAAVEDIPLPHVRTARVTTTAARPHAQHLVLLEPSRRARLAPRVGGQVVSIAVREQQDVLAGQVLVRLAGTNARGSLVAAKAMWSRVDAQLRESQRELQTARKLADQGVEGARAVERYEAQAVALDAQLREAEGQLMRAKDGTDATEIVAPFAGTITSIDTEIGEFLAAGSSALVLSALDPLAAEVPLAERTMVLAASNPTDYRVDLRGETHTAKLDWLAKEAKPGTSTFVARLLLPNPERRFLAGESARIDVHTKGVTQALAVPPTAIRRAVDQVYVLVLTGETVRKVAVTVADDAEGWVLVEGELSAGDVVISHGPDRIRDGDRVVVDGEVAVPSAGGR